MLQQDIHSQSLFESTALSGYYIPDMIAPLEVITVLNAAGIRFMLLGLHGIAGWLHEPRGTKDVDVLVAARHHKKAVRALQAAFPHLEVDDQPVVTRLRHPDTKKVLIDVMKPNQELFRDALRHSQAVSSGDQTYHIPSLEMALATKFAPMISPNRADEDKHQDAHDFILMVKSNPDLDLDKLAELGELVYPGGGNEIRDMVDRVRTGKKLLL